MYLNITSFTAQYLWMLKVLAVVDGSAALATAERSLCCHHLDDLTHEDSSKEAVNTVGPCGSSCCGDLLGTTLIAIIMDVSIIL
jgi:hypothetical protein